MCPKAKKYNLGEVYQGGGVIYHVIDIDRVYVEVEIPETYISQIEEQMNVTVYFDALGRQEFPALIDTILPSGTPENRTFVVKALVENPKHTIKPGMFARVNIVLNDSAPEVIVAKDTVAYASR